MYPYWPRNILDDLLPHVLESIGEPVADMFADGARDADPPRLGERLQPCSDVYAVAEDVLGFDDHIAKVDPDAEPDPALLRHVGLSIDHRALDLDRTPDGIDHARKFREQAVAGILHDPAAMLSDLRINQFAEMRFQALVRAFLIGPHQPRIARHIGREDRCKPAGLAHIASLAARRRPDSRSSRSSGRR